MVRFIKMLGEFLLSYRFSYRYAVPIAASPRSGAEPHPYSDIPPNNNLSGCCKPASVFYYHIIFPEQWQILCCRRGAERPVISTQERIFGKMLQKRRRKFGCAVYIICSKSWHNYVKNRKIWLFEANMLLFFQKKPPVYFFVTAEDSTQYFPIFRYNESPGRNLPLRLVPGRIK